VIRDNVAFGENTNVTIDFIQFSLLNELSFLLSKDELLCGNVCAIVAGHAARKLLI